MKHNFKNHLANADLVTLTWRANARQVASPKHLERHGYIDNFSGWQQEDGAGSNYRLDEVVS